MASRDGLIDFLPHEWGCGRRCYARGVPYGKEPPIGAALAPDRIDSDKNGSVPMHATRVSL